MLDVAAMRKLHKKVNLVPVVAKSDSLTTAELTRFKSQVLQELKQHDIQVCQYLPCTHNVILKSKFLSCFFIHPCNISIDLSVS